MMPVVVVTTNWYPCALALNALAPNRRSVGSELRWYRLPRFRREGELCWASWSRV